MIARMDTSKKGLWRWMFRLVLALVAAGLLYALLVEVRARVTVWREQREGYLRTPNAPHLGRIMVFDPDLIWTLRPGVEHLRVEKMYAGEGNTPVTNPFDVSTNAHGFRGAELAPDGTRTRILAVGDSTTFGLEVNDEQAWPAQLQAILNAGEEGADYEVANAGVMGYSVLQSLRFLHKRGFDLAPDVVVVTSGNNECDRWSALPDREKMDLIAKLDPWHVGSVAYQASRARRIERHAAATAEEHPRVHLDVYAETLKAIFAESQRRGVAVIYVLWPWEWQFDEEPWPWPTPPGPRDYQRVLRETCAALGAPLVDLEALWREAPPDYIDCVHVGEPGYRRVAEAVAAAIGKVMSPSGG